MDRPIRYSGCDAPLAFFYHELFHALSFYHERARPDASEIVSCKLFDCVLTIANASSAIEPMQISVATFSTKYDFNSVMNYKHRQDSWFMSNVKNRDMIGLHWSEGESSSTDFYELNMHYDCCQERKL